MARIFNKKAEAGHKKAIARRLVAVRTALGLSQADIATRAGISQTAYSKWELGDTFPNPTNLIMFCAQTGVDFNYVYGGSFAGLDPSLAARLGAAHPDIVPPSVRKGRPKGSNRN